MANVGSLAVSLGLNSAQFTAGLAEAATGLKGFQGAVTNVLGAITGSITSLAATLKIPFDYIREGIDQVAAVGKQAEQLGVSTEFLSTIQFQLGRSADQAGDAIRGMERGLHGLAETSGDSAVSLEKLGLNMDAFAGMKPEEMYAELARQIGAMDDQSQKLAISTRLFRGELGAKMLPLLEKGAEGFKEMAKNADLAGMMVRGIEADQAVKAARAMDDIARVMQGFQRTLAVQFAPIIIQLAESFESWLRSMGGVRGVIAWFMPILVEGLNKAVDFMEQLVKGALEFADIMVNTAITLGDIAKGHVGGDSDEAKAARAGFQAMKSDWTFNINQFFHDLHGSIDKMKGFQVGGELPELPGARPPPGVSGLAGLAGYAGLWVNDLLGATPFKKLERLLGGPEAVVRAPGALLAGTEAAHAAEVAYERGGAADKQEDMRQSLKQLVKLAEIMADAAEKVKVKGAD